MTKFYTPGGQSNSPYRWIFILVCCAIVNFIYIPKSHAQLSNYSYAESTSQLSPSSSLLKAGNEPQPTAYQSITSPAIYTLSMEPVLLMSFFKDSTDELSGNQDNPYLLAENPKAQTITLLLPKVDVGKIMIAVYSSSGNLLMKKSVRNQKEREKEMEMDLKELQAGAYFLEIQAAEIYEKFSFMLE